MGLAMQFCGMSEEYETIDLLGICLKHDFNMILELLFQMWDSNFGTH